MALIIPPGYAQATVRLTNAAVQRPAAITFGVDSGAYEGDYVDLANDITEQFDLTIGTQMDNQVTIGPTTLSVGQDGGENLAVVGSAAYGGALAMDSTPPNVALLVRKLTQRGGRRGRGRFYLPWCLADTDVTEAGIVLSSKVTSMNTQVASFLARLNGTVLGMTFPAAMHILHSSGDSTAGIPNEVTGIQVDPLVATQRRRLGR